MIALRNWSWKGIYCLHISRATKAVPFTFMIHAKKPSRFSKIHQVGIFFLIFIILSQKQMTDRMRAFPRKIKGPMTRRYGLRLVDSIQV
jgi:hypothetical protein